MPRALRSDHPNLCHHVMARGNNKGPIFLDERDYRCFERALNACLPRFGILLYAYALLPNHIHLQLRSMQGRLSSFMRRLLGGYAMRFNHRHGRVGHVFQGRFRSRLILENNYMLEVSRYIHMNPVKASLAKSPEDYPYSSFPALWLGTGPVPVVRSLYVQRFPGLEGSRDFYRFTVARRVPAPDETGWPAQPGWYAKGEPAEAPEETPLPDPNALLQTVAERYGLSLKALLTAWRDPCLGRARIDAMLLLRDEGGLSLKEISSLLNLRNPRSVSNALRCRGCMSA